METRDTMNPLQKSMVQGRQDLQLSSFLPEGHGHRPPRKTLEVRPLMKDSADEPSSSNKLHISATARDVPRYLHDPPLGLGFLTQERKSLGRMDPGLASTAAAIHNPGNNPLKKLQIETLLDNRSLFNTKSRRGKRGEKVTVPDEWSMDNFNDK